MKRANLASNLPRIDQLNGVSNVPPAIPPHGGAGAHSLTCLYSAISTENGISSPLDNTYEARKQRHARLERLISNNNELSTVHKRTAHVLAQSVAQIASRHGLDKLGFLTLTFADPVYCPKEAQRRFNSFVTHVIKPRYGDYLGVFERQKSGRIHFHLLVSLPVDIRTGYNFEKGKRKRSANEHLKNEWAYLRIKSESHGFGRTELEPIRSTSEAISKYVGKYISKHIGNRNLEDRGIRTVRYSQTARAGTSKFMFHSEGSKQWRKNVSEFAERISELENIQINNLDDLSRFLGARWAYHFRTALLTSYQPED